MVYHKGTVMYQVICEEKKLRGFGIEYYTFRFASSMLYTYEEGVKEIEEMKKMKSFERCRFHLNKIDLNRLIS